MNASARFFLMVMILGATVIGWGTSAWAQDDPAGQNQVAAPEQASATSTAPATKKVLKTPDSFERTARLESMRYRHLWLAYGFIWVVVFIFVFRTWKLHQSNRGELDALTRRLKALEAEQPQKIASATSGTASTSISDSAPQGETDGDT